MSTVIKLLELPQMIILASYFIQSRQGTLTNSYLKINKLEELTVH